MRTYKITWTETERGWGRRPDGYSFHTSPEAAAAYLKREYDALPAATPDEYSYPSSGWNSSVMAEIVDVKDNGPIAKELEKSGSTRVFKIFSDPAYQEARDLAATGNTVNIDYRAYKPPLPQKPKPSPKVAAKRYKL